MTSGTVPADHFINLTPTEHQTLADAVGINKIRPPDLGKPRVVVSPGCFKPTMSAVVVAVTMAAGVRDAGAASVLCPLADGSQGTATVLQSVMGGEFHERTVTGPFGLPVRGAFLLTSQRLAVIDTATASGLDLMPTDRRIAKAANTFGTGELVVAAAMAGAEHILLASGDCAMTDGGFGALAAIAEGGGLRGARLTVLCESQAPFKRSAAALGRQKGLHSAMVERATDRARAVANELPRNPCGVSGAGSARGLAGALWSVYQAEMVCGIDTVLDSVGFNDLIAGTAGVITGAGNLDSRSGQGTVIAGVVRRAIALSVPVWAVVGKNKLTPGQVAGMQLSGVLEADHLAELRHQARFIAEGLISQKASQRGRSTNSYAGSQL